MKRSGIKPGKPLARTGPLKPGKKGFRTYADQDVFRAAALERDGGCIRPSENCSAILDAHHLIEKAALAKRELAHLAADPANGITLCRLHHDLHHARVLPLTWEHVPERAKDFADALGLRDLLIRTYPTKEDTA